jgi:hypothetical protein
VSIKVRNQLIFWVVVVFLTVPFLLYFIKFHGPLSRNIDDWAKAGDYFGGVYTVIVGVLTLAVLVSQASMQQRLEKFQYDQTYLSRSRGDLQYYLDKLHANIKVDLPAARNFVSSAHELSRLEIFLNHYEKTSGKVFLETNVSSGIPGEIFSTWLAINSILIALDKSKEDAYKQELTFALTKIHSRLSYSTATAVEQFVSQISGDKLDMKLFFPKKAETN